MTGRAGAARKSPPRINGQFLEPTPGQAIRLTFAEARWQDAMWRLRRVDPSWKPTPGVEYTVEGLISNLESETQEAEGRLAESASSNIPSPRGGHHWVPRAVFEVEGLPPDTKKVFENARSGALEDDNVNIWNRPHIEYNEVVGEAIESFLVRNSIRADDA
jgi:hypothetical protein